MTLVLSRPVLRALLAVISVTLLGTLWSVISGTYLDTSNPLISNLPHPKHSTSYFANKRNVFNTLFVKRAWGWTSLLILANTFTTRRRLPVRLWRWGLATFVWLSFVAWFFGPSLRARLAAYSGAECIVQLPVSADNGTVQLVTIPAEYCIKMTRLSAKEHADLIQDALMGNTGAGASAASFNLPEDWMGVPKLTRGHDVSGHVFLLSLSILAIVDNLVLGTPAAGVQAMTTPQLLVGASSVLLVGLWYWMLLMTSVYFHAPFEKVSGLLVGVVAFLFSRIPYPGNQSDAIPVAIARPVPGPANGKEDGKDE